MTLVCFWVAVAQSGGREAVVRYPPGVVHKMSLPEREDGVWCYLPASMTNAAPSPLVYSFHGAGGRGDEEIADWVGLADEHGFIVVCPTSKAAGAYFKFGASKILSGQDYLDEMRTVEAVFGQLSQQVRLHPWLRMVTGFSGGGNPAYVLGLTRPDLFSFLAARSANFPGQRTLASARGVAFAAEHSEIFVFWGERDHPTIREHARVAVEWMEGLPARRLKTRTVAYMRHESRPEIAAEWFAERMAQRRRWMATEGGTQHARVMQRAEEALRVPDRRQALEAFGQAALLELEMPGLGSNGLMRAWELSAVLTNAVTESAKGLGGEGGSRLPGGDPPGEGQARP